MLSLAVRIQSPVLVSESVRDISLFFLLYLGEETFVTQAELELD